MDSDEDPTSDVPESPTGDAMTRAHVANKASAIQNIHTHSHTHTHTSIVRNASPFVEIG